MKNLFSLAVYAADRNALLIGMRDDELEYVRPQLDSTRAFIAQTRAAVSDNWHRSLWRGLESRRELATDGARKYLEQQERFGALLREKDAALRTLSTLLPLVQQHIQCLEGEQVQDGVSVGVESREQSVSALLKQLYACEKTLQVVKKECESVCVLCLEPANDQLGALVALPCQQTHGNVVHQACLVGHTDTAGVHMQGLLEQAGATCPLCRGALIGATPVNAEEEVAHVLAEGAPGYEELHFPLYPRQE